LKGVANYWNFGHKCYWQQSGAIGGKVVVVMKVGDGNVLCYSKGVASMGCYLLEGDKISGIFYR